MKNKIYIGTSSYNNRLWQPQFYPETLPGSKWFEFYCEHFITYELNVTFYKFPTVRTLQSWYKKCPSGFRFSVKAPKQITHTMKFEGCETELGQFYSICREGLQDKLGCVLFQLPPSFSYTPERLHLILQKVDRSFSNIIEFRNASWWRDDVFTALYENNITFCSVSYPGLPNEIIRTTPTGYLRLHGNPKLFYSDYSDAEILRYIEKISDNGNFHEFYMYFNNTAGLSGIKNALFANSIVNKIDSNK